MDEMINKTFGLLTVNCLVPQPNINSKYKVLFYECICKCGNKKIVQGRKLRTGHTKSCGCLVKKHGMKDTKIYKCWSAMKNRCLNPQNPAYKNYGARGITVCTEWFDFRQFYLDMKDTYQENLTLERIDNNKGYDKKNCKWHQLPNKAKIKEIIGLSLSMGQLRHYQIGLNFLK